jgi:DNA-directed RNA polymerase subunit RPC12/RpoP
VEYKCPNCGGVVAFDAVSGRMRCAYCGADFDPATFQNTAAVAVQPQPDALPPWDGAAPAGADGWEGQAWTDEELAQLRQYTCPSCGGQLVTEANTAATHCPFCDSPTILPVRLTGVRRPDAVLPFKVTKAEVTEALRAHLKGKRLAPKLFLAESRIDAVLGVYVPFWLFDTALAADIAFEGKQITSWSDSRNQYTRTDTYAVRRAGQVVYERVPVDAATKIDNDYTEAIEPFDYSAAVPYQPGYLLGYLAQTYDDTAEACRPRARQRMVAALRQSFAASVRPYNSLQTRHEQIQVTAEQVHYALLPVWLLNTVYRGQTYSFAMNGRSGRFVGQLPMSWSRFWGWLSGLFVAVGAIAGGLAYLALRLL